MKALTMTVEGHWIRVRTGVRFPSAPLAPRHDIPCFGAFVLHYMGAKSRFRSIATISQCFRSKKLGSRLGSEH